MEDQVRFIGIQMEDLKITHKTRDFTQYMT